jgi:hypothetical protein
LVGFGSTGVKASDIEPAAAAAHDKVQALTLFAWMHYKSKGPTLFLYLSPSSAAVALPFH